MKIAVIGGGVMGLTIGHRLSLKDCQVDIIESQEQLGGLSTWFNYGDFTWDKYYHVILKSDQELINLIDELGLSQKLRWSETKTGFLWQGQHVSMSNHWEFIRFPVLNFPQKIRLALGILYSQHCTNPASLHQITAVNWMKQIFGEKIYQTIWAPLLKSKFGVLKDEVPAITLWSILNRYYSTRNSGDGKERMGYLQNEGLKSLFDALSTSIIDRGGALYTGTQVSQVRQRSDKKFSIETNKGTMTYDRVISTVPTPLLKKLTPGIEGITSGKQNVKYLGVIRMALVLKEPLSPYYVTNLIDQGFPFTGIIEVSAMTKPDEMVGRTLVMLPRYDVPDSPWFELPDSEIESSFLAKMRETWPTIDHQIVNTFIHREKIVQALWLETPPKIGDIPTYCDGNLWNVNTELCGGSTLNNNAVIQIANIAAEKFSL